MGKLTQLRLALAFLVAAALGACASGGGGGGGAVSPPPPPPPPPTSSTYLNPPLVIPAAPAGVNQTEYSANYGVGATGAAAAWSRGFTGAGIKIGVIDDGIVASSDPAYAEIAGRIDMANSIDALTLPGASFYRDQLSSDLTHGAELSSLIAGNLDGQKTVGVAHGATIIAVRADNGGGTFSDIDLANALNYAVSKGVKVVNFSLGSSGATSTPLRNAIANATANGVIIVASAGNSGPSATDPNYPGVLAADASVSRGLIIIAGGVNGDGTFNDRSNFAGSAKDFYLTAPGWEIVVPDFGAPGPLAGFQRCYPDLASSGSCASNMVVIQGTSYASPLTAGAVALLLQAFPGMTPAQIVQLILNSTDDQAEPGVDVVTGHGRLNLVKAFQPAGTVAAPVGGSQIAAGDLIGVSGAAFGDAFTQADWSSVGFDSYGRTFAVNLASSWRSAGRMASYAESAPLLWRRDEGGGLSTSFALADAPPPAQLNIIGETPKASFRADKTLPGGASVTFAAGASAAPEVTAANVDGHLAFASYQHGGAFTQRIGDKARLSIVSEGGSVPLGFGLGVSARRATAVRLDYGNGPLTLGAGVGAVSEEGSVLGAAWGERFGTAPQAKTRFLAGAAGWRLARDWDVGLEAEFGATRVSSATGWLTAPGDIVTSAGALAVRWSVMPKALRALSPKMVGAMSFSVSQPLRVEDGAFTAMLATATEYGRQSLAFTPRLIDAAPSGREIDASVIYSLWHADNFAARFSATYATEPGHRADAPPATSVMMGLRYGF